MQPGSASDGSAGAEALGPVSRMMMSVAGHAITSYIQFRALAELLISRGVISRDELEQQFSLMREDQLQRTIDEWFPADVAYHLKMAINSAEASDAAYRDSSVPSDVDEIARARSMQSSGQ